VLFQVDANLRPWLLEVNTSPSFKCPSPLDVLIKSEVLIDTLNLAGVTVAGAQPAAEAVQCAAESDILGKEIQAFAASVETVADTVEKLAAAVAAIRCFEAERVRLLQTREICASGSLDQAERGRDDDYSDGTIAGYNCLYPVVGTVTGDSCTRILSLHALYVYSSCLTGIFRGSVGYQPMFEVNTVANEAVAEWVVAGRPVGLAGAGV
jgi:hypothetical protein